MRYLERVAWMACMLFDGKVRCRNMGLGRGKIIRLKQILKKTFTILY
jgi:hypothetical protein